MTFKEFTRKYTGAKPGPRPESAAGLRSVTEASKRKAGVDKLPWRWDWRDYGVVTPVKDQDGCGSCWAFSVVGAVESINAIWTGNRVTLSEQQVLDCSGAGNCVSGYTNYAFDYAIQTGITADYNYPPYVARQESCRFENKPPIVKIDGQKQVAVDNETALKEAVVYHGPISVAIHASDAFKSYGGGVFTGPCGTKTNHAVLVVGYGETREGLHYWIVKNSWNTTWGEEGYVRMIRDISDEQGICGIATYAIYPIYHAASAAAAATAATY